MSFVSEGRARAAAAAEAEFVSSTKQVGSVGPGVTLTELLARASAEQPGDGVRADGRPAPMPAVARLRGGWSTRHVLLLFGLCFITGGDCMPVSALQASLTYSRASIYDGLPAGLVDTMHGVMDNRLRTVSSAPTTRAAAASWPPSSCT